MHWYYCNNIRDGLPNLPRKNIRCQLTMSKLSLFMLRILLFIYLFFYQNTIFTNLCSDNNYIHTTYCLLLIISEIQGK